MKALSRNALAAALSLGAAVFAWPAQTAIVQCPRPLFWRTNMPINEAYERMIQFASQKVARAPSIFKGHAVSAEFIGIEDELPAFIVTFKVSEWMKGSGQPYARIVYSISCDGCPSILEMEDEIVQEYEEAIYTSDPNDKIFMKKKLPIKNIDGVLSPCSHYGRRVEAVSQQGRPPRFEHKWFLLDLAMRSEIEKLPSWHRAAP